MAKDTDMRHNEYLKEQNQSQYDSLSDWEANVTAISNSRSISIGVTEGPTNKKAMD